MALPAGEDLNAWLAANGEFIHRFLLIQQNESKCPPPPLTPNAHNSVPFFVLLVVDFFNEVSLIWGIICELGIPSCPPGDGYPKGFEYRWAHPHDEKSKGPVRRCSGPQYVDYVLTWIEDELNNGLISPPPVGNTFWWLRSLL